ncbi:MAG: hypothetical protein KKG92_15035 [Gammaproteobacteria bacterium]|nr:hypothetical protein [Gammaproteobacteria bacterium]
MRQLMRLLFALLFAHGATVQAGTWVLLSVGDCPGPQVNGSAGLLPDAIHCTPVFTGKTALCFTNNCNPGCQYIDVPTTQCRGGAELADVYTCVQEAPAAGS